MEMKNYSFCLDLFIRRPRFLYYNHIIVKCWLSVYYSNNKWKWRKIFQFQSYSFFFTENLTPLEDARRRTLRFFFLLTCLTVGTGECGWAGTNVRCSWLSAGSSIQAWIVETSVGEGLTVVATVTEWTQTNVGTSWTSQLAGSAVHAWIKWACCLEGLAESSWETNWALADECWSTSHLASGSIHTWVVGTGRSN